MLWFTATALNVQSSMGVIFMAGIVVANGVLLIDFANKQRRLGFNVEEAMVSAATTRFRPILMTFLATFLDLLPMALGGRGAEANAPLARAVLGGLLSSTFLTLLVVPALYTMFLRADLKDPSLIERELSGVDASSAPTPFPQAETRVSPLPSTSD